MTPEKSKKAKKGFFYSTGNIIYRGLALCERTYILYAGMAGGGYILNETEIMEDTSLAETGTYLLSLAVACGTTKVFRYLGKKKRKREEKRQREELAIKLQKGYETEMEELTIKLKQGYETEMTRLERKLRAKQVKADRLKKAVLRSNFKLKMRMEESREGQKNVTKMLGYLTAEMSKLNETLEENYRERKNLYDERESLRDEVKKLRTELDSQH